MTNGTNRTNGTNGTKRYLAAGRLFECHICRCPDFIPREIQMNTAAMTFFDLDWANKKAIGLVCFGCGYIHQFMPEALLELLPPPEPGAPT